MAKLARINLSSEEKEKLQKEFEAILSYISALKEANIDGLADDFSKRETFNAMRPDENAHEAGKFTKNLLEGLPALPTGQAGGEAGAPFTEGGYVKVKHVFE